jgi:hypothetical protein
MVLAFGNTIKGYIIGQRNNPPIHQEGIAKAAPPAVKLMTWVTFRKSRPRAAAGEDTSTRDRARPDTGMVRKVNAHYMR